MSRSSLPDAGTRPGTIRALLKLMPFVRPVLGRTILSLFVYLALSMVALLVPVVLQWIVDEPLVER